MRRTLSPPPLLELWKTCAVTVPAVEIRGKYSGPSSTAERVLIQLSRKAACIWATIGPSKR